MNRISKSTDRFSKKVSVARKATGKLSKKMLDTKNVIAGIGIGAATIFPIKAAMDFESVMADVRKVVDFKTPKQFEQLKKQIMESSLSMGKMPSKIAEIAVEGGKLGILPDKLGEFISLVSKTSVAFDMLEGESGKKIASIKNKLGLTTGATANLMDAVNFLADNTAASGSDMVEIIERVSGTMNVLGMPKKFVAGWAAFANQIEVTPHLAASGFNQIINRMKAMPGMTRRLLEDPNKAVHDLFTKLSKLDPVRRAKMSMKLFGPEAGRFADKAVTNMELLDKTLGLVAGNAGFAGSMERELQVKLKTTAVQVGRVKTAFTNLAITVGNTVLPLIKKIVPILVSIANKVTDFVKENPKIAKLGLLFGAALAALVPLGIAIGAASFALGGLGVLVSWATLVVGGLGIAGYFLWKKWDKVKEVFGKVKAVITNFVNDSIFYAQDAVDGLIESLSKLWTKLDSFSGGILGKVGNFLGLGGDDKVQQNVINKSVSAQNAKAMNGSLNGRIDVFSNTRDITASGSLTSSLPGNLGLNMSNAQGAF